MAKSYRPMAVPAGVDVKVQPGEVTVKGKLGTLSVPVLSGLTVKVAACMGKVIHAATARRAAVRGNRMAVIHGRYRLHAYKVVCRESRTSPWRFQPAWSFFKGTLSKFRW